MKLKKPVKNTKLRIFYKITYALIAHVIFVLEFNLILFKDKRKDKFKRGDN